MSGLDNEAIVADAQKVFAIFGKEGEATDASHVVNTLEFILAMIVEAHRDAKTPKALREACEAQGMLIHHFAKGLRLEFQRSGIHALSSVVRLPSGPGPTNDL